MAVDKFGDPSPSMSALLPVVSATGVPPPPEQALAVTRPLAMPMMRPACVPPLQRWSSAVLLVPWALCAGFGQSLS